jgi:hypothetical protein
VVFSGHLAQHNSRHATKNKGVSHETMEYRRQFLFRTFDFLQHNPEKAWPAASFLAWNAKNMFKNTWVELRNSLRLSIIMCKLSTRLSIILDI